jgi:hypothetical protein
MAKTLRFGQRYETRLSSRIDTFVVRRRTDAGYDAARAALDAARQAAWEVSPRLAGKPRCTFQPRVAPFGKREA